MPGDGRGVEVEGAVDAGLLDTTPGGGLPPRALIFTVLGLYARDLGGWVGVRTLIRLLGATDVDAQAVRSSVSRLKRRGLLLAEKRDGVAGYALSDYAQRVLEIGDQRIFARGGHEDDPAGWVLVVFSVPESERGKRHTLRSRLSWLGFGTVSAGVWVGPAHLHDDAVRVIASEDLTAYVDLFRADYAAFGDPAEKVAQWWDLAALDAQYRAFLDLTLPVAERWAATDERPPQACFADYVRTLTRWRRFPYLDPGLPTALLPAGWQGQRAAATFFDLKDTLEGPARAYVDDALS